jgi:hypothetical protein
MFGSKRLLLMLRAAADVDVGVDAVACRCLHACLMEQRARLLAASVELLLVNVRSPRRKVIYPQLDNFYERGAPSAVVPTLGISTRKMQKTSSHEIFSIGGGPARALRVPLRHFSPCWCGARG